MMAVNKVKGRRADGACDSRRSLNSGGEQVESTIVGGRTSETGRRDRRDWEASTARITLSSSSSVWAGW